MRREGEALVKRPERSLGPKKEKRSGGREILVRGEERVGGGLFFFLGITNIRIKNLVPDSLQTPFALTRFEERLLRFDD